MLNVNFLNLQLANEFKHKRIKTQRDTLLHFIFSLKFLSVYLLSLEKA